MYCLQSLCFPYYKSDLLCVCGVREGSTDISLESGEAATLETLDYITDR